MWYLCCELWNGNLEGRRGRAGVDDGGTGDADHRRRREARWWTRKHCTWRKHHTHNMTRWLLEIIIEDLFNNHHNT